VALSTFRVHRPLRIGEKAVADPVEWHNGFRHRGEAVFHDIEMEDRVVVVVLFRLDNAQPLPRVVADRVGIAQSPLA